MPKPKNILNAFTAQELHEITGLSVHMINYLRRHQILQPAYGQSVKARGAVRYYSYRDAVAAKLIQTLRESGVALHKLKLAINELSSNDGPWATQDGRDRIKWVVSDGVDVFFEDHSGVIRTLTSDRQAAFKFVININNLENEILNYIPEEKRANYSLENKSLIITTW